MIFKAMKTIHLIFLFAVLLVADLDAQTLNFKQSRYFQKKVRTIQPNESFEKLNWKPLAKKLKKKKIVLLGEFNHGSKEVFLLRNKLIEYLHSELDFKVVLFESGIGELITSELQKKTISPQQMCYGLIGGWRTAEFRNLMKYIKENDISLAGFDVQRSGGSYKYLLNELAAQNKIDSGYYANLESSFGRVQKDLRNRKTVYDSVRVNTTNLLQAYERLYQLLPNDDPSKLSFLVRKTLINRMEFLKYMLQFKKDQDWRKRWAARDSLMAENIIWLSERIFPDEKLLVIGHNFHIAKSNEKERVMGAILQERFPDDCYSIGVFAGRGSFANNSGKEVQMNPPDSVHLDIKTLIEQLDGASHFLPIPKKSHPTNRWLFEPIVVNDTFIDLNGSHSMVLAQHFDALLLLEKVSVPDR